MKPVWSLDTYANAIKALPDKVPLEQADLLTDTFRIVKSGSPTRPAPMHAGSACLTRGKANWNGNFARGLHQDSHTSELITGG